MYEHRNLVSFHIIEVVNKQNLVTWSYPSLTDEVRIILLEKCYSKYFIEDGLFYFMKKNNLWIYVKNFSDVFRKAIVVISQNFSPGNYRNFCEILIRKYLKRHNPVDLVRVYLKLFITGVTEFQFQENGSDIRINMRLKTESVHETKLKEIIKQLKLQTVLIFNGILLKKRILVYHSSVNELQEALIAMSKLVTIRNASQYLIPFIQDEKISKNLTFYLAGTLEKHLRSNSKICDIFVDMVSGDIEANSKDVMEMTKVHKEIAEFMIQAVETGVTETSIVEELNNRTISLLTSLKSLGTNTKDNRYAVSINDVKSKNLHINTENFMINLALAENMIQ